jgi:serine/threonine protein phosphatase PrpC
MKLTDTQPDLVPVAAHSSLSGQPLVVHSFGMTDRGQVRPRNEDHFLVAELTRTLQVCQTSLKQEESQSARIRGHVFIVADGMGGHAAGDVASALSLLSIEAFLLNSLKRFTTLKCSEEATVLDEFEAAVRQADARLFEESAQHPERMGMGTTLTMAFALRDCLFVAHAGDSRCYLSSAGQLRQVTHDDTVVAQMVRQGLLSKEEASRHSYRNIVTNVLGGHERGVHVEVQRLDLQPGDVVLLCSDGLSGMVSDEQIAAILQHESDPEKACRRLVAAANDGGGKDNITAIVARFDTR